MTWQPIDFQRIVALDHSLVDQLSQYLAEKEGDLAKSIIEDAPFASENALPPQLLPSPITYLKLSDAVEVFGKRLRQVLQSDDLETLKKNYKATVESLNQSFWEYGEVLEGCVKELFQQIEQLGIEQWKSDIGLVLDNFKDLLSHHLEDLIWAYKRMESQLVEMRNAVLLNEGRGAFFKKLKASFYSVLDDTLLSTLEKSDKFLKLNHKRFSKKFEDYLELDEKIEQIMRKLSGYHVLSSFDDSFQERFRKIYYYVKMGQLTTRPKTLSIGELMRALSQSESVEASIELFKEYAKALKIALFHQSRVLKKQSIRYLEEETGRKKIEETMKGYRAEILTLGSTIARYREFLLRTDPNPYVRSRWGFPEGIVAPEPEQAKQLLDLEFEADHLEALYEDMNKSILKVFEGGREIKREILSIPPDIQRLLHEMGQPLSSYGMVKSRAERIIANIKELDELGTPNPNVPKYIAELLSKLLRADWKYHIVQEIPLFQEIFSIHMGIMGTLDDRKHLNRLNKFKHLIQELENWVTLRETRKHQREIEFDINDLKGYLQDFLAHVQRIDKQEPPLSELQIKKAIQETSHELLIYRYLFGQFFHKLENTSNEGKRLRLKLLFVDQYFESVDQKIHELKQAEHIKKEEKDVSEEDA